MYLSHGNLAILTGGIHTNFAGILSDRSLREYFHGARDSTTAYFRLAIVTCSVHFVGFVRSFAYGFGGALIWQRVPVGSVTASARCGLMALSWLDLLRDNAPLRSPSAHLFAEVFVLIMNCDLRRVAAPSKNAVWTSYKLSEGRQVVDLGDWPFSVEVVSDGDGC